MLDFKALSVTVDECPRGLRYSVKHVFAMAGALSVGWNIKYIGTNHVDNCVTYTLEMVLALLQAN